MENFNWDDIQENSYINEEGTYTLTVEKYEDGTSANGNTFHKYTCKSEDGELITLSLYIVDKAMWKYKNFITACTGTKPSGEVNINALPSLVVGKRFIAEVKRCADKMNVETGVMEPSKYFEIVKFHPLGE